MLLRVCCITINHDEGKKWSIIVSNRNEWLWFPLSVLCFSVWSYYDLKEQRDCVIAVTGINGTHTGDCMKFWSSLKPPYNHQKSWVQTPQGAVYRAMSATQKMKYFIMHLRGSYTNVVLLYLWKVYLQAFPGKKYKVSCSSLLSYSFMYPSHCPGPLHCVSVHWR